MSRTAKNSDDPILLSGQRPAHSQFGHTVAALTVDEITVTQTDWFDPDESLVYVSLLGHLALRVTFRRRRSSADHRLVATWPRIERRAQMYDGAELPWRAVAKFCSDYRGRLNRSPRVPAELGLSSEQWAAPLDWLCGGYFDPEWPKHPSPSSSGTRNRGRG